MIKFLTLPLLAVLSAAYGSVSDIEILLVIIAALGLVFSLYNFVQSLKDWRFLNDKGAKDHGPRYDPRMVVAWNALRSELARALIQVYFLTLGTFAMFLAEVPPEHHQATRIVVFGFIFRCGFIAASLLLSLKSYWSYQIRKRVLEHYD